MSSIYRPDLNGNAVSEGKLPASIPHWEVKAEPRHINLDAEAAILGAILFDNRVYDDVVDFLLPEHFYDPIHMHLYRAMQMMIDAGSVASPITLKEYISRIFDYDPEFNGGKYVEDIAKAVPSTFGARSYGEVVRDMWIHRQADLTALKILTTVRDVEDDPKKVAAAFASDLERVHEMDSDNHEKHIADGVEEWLDRRMKGETNIICSTGIRCLDNAIGGISEGDLIVVGGRPSMGKSVLAANISRGVGEQGFGVHFSSLEMTNDSDLRPRVLADLLFTEYGKDAPTLKALRRGKINAGLANTVGDAVKELAALPWRVDDGSSATLSQVKASIRRSYRHFLADDRRMGVAIVDYLQLMQFTGNNRVTDIGDATASLKRLAKELKIGIILLSQLSRAVENRENRRPHNGDLRESGSIEQDADVIIFPYRHEYYLQKFPPGETASQAQKSAHDKSVEEFKNHMELIIGKARNEKTTTVHVKFWGAHQAVRDFDDAPRGEAQGFDSF